ncbi:SCP2 sterol-binding domain-containing protein [Thauera sp.]|jgi:predicted lipid carrier protein YhbT|uniref:ubiquinone anaerobic biosynthesis accessory factor UbiT n=1 Tax=Thauera sp. TaxID=1905334 RepID=UPI00260FAC2F|nr:SCP2 sterol-binding domain-containing protein [Thauera sp.]MCK6408663.1 SCP2 sterol-binding domain-containing protein [Thauera sp.]
MPAFPALPRPPLLTELLPGNLRQRIGVRLENLRIPDFTLPAPLARLVSRLPQQPPTHVLTLALNLALDRILPRDTLAPLTGRQLQMRVLDAGLTLDFTLGERGFRRAAPAAGARPDLIISATTRDFMALALREEDPDTLFFSRRLRMEGDTELGLLVKNTLDAVDWDALKARLLGRRS